MFRGYSSAIPPHSIRIVGGNTVRLVESEITFLSYVDRIILHDDFGPLSGANNIALIIVS